LPRVLVFAYPSSETDEWLHELERRSDLCVLRVSSVRAARFTLQEVTVDLFLVGPTVDDDMFSSLLEQAKDLRPRTPVLAVHSEPTQIPPESRSATLALLRSPVLPDVLSRSVDLALGLR
jgi:hypothetical protein